MGAVFLMAGTSANAQLLHRATSMKQELKREVKSNFLQLSKQATASRIQPSRSQVYDANNTPREQIKYDVYGNITEVSYHDDYEGFTHFLIYQYDYSKGYPVLLNRYSYLKPDSAEPSEPEYELRTTVNASNIRTAIEAVGYRSITLDAAGHVIRTERDYGMDNELETQEITWNGDQITAYKYDYESADEETHLDLKDIEIVYSVRPFNAFEIDYSDFLTDFDESGAIINANGTISMKNEDGSTMSGTMTITSEASTDKKDMTMTVKLNDQPNVIQKIKYTDDNGSYSNQMDYQDGEKEEYTYTFNEYGDLVKTQELDYYDNALDYTYTRRYEWTYDNGKPLEKKFFSTGYKSEEVFNSKEVFLAWHNGTSVRNIIAGDARILNASLYTLNGILIRTLTPEEVQTVSSLDVPQNGVYLLKINTDQGTKVHKIAIVQ